MSTPRYSIVTANLAISLDGFTAGPDQSLEHPFGTGADALTAWMFQTGQPGREVDKQILHGVHADTGAHVMGRNMFGPGRGDWDLDGTGSRPANKLPRACRTGDTAP